MPVKDMIITKFRTEYLINVLIYKVRRYVLQKYLQVKFLKLVCCDKKWCFDKKYKIKKISNYVSNLYLENYGMIQ